MKKLLPIILLLFGIQGFSQKVSLVGTVVDEEKKPVLYATVSLLNHDDSTLMFYGISNDKGYYEIKNIQAGKYVLQSAAFGYKTLMKPVHLSKDSAAVLQMEMPGINLNEVQITADVPILIKKDTIEYNADAFKTRPDATTEDLLKKLPGVEVDRAGNVKAQGENVSKVLVDGKEFFGDDPKVATKNLPADAVKKVQVYDKKSDQAEMTGIDDGTHQKVVNLVLKDGKKSAILGDMMAGYGTDNHYQGAAKLYRFKQKSQFAALGMLNNINQFGFTFSDYLSFSGGLRSLSSGNGLGNIISNNSAPINFGQPVSGLVTSGAGGLNYSYEKSKNNHFSISYLGNGSEKKLDETVYSKNFIENSFFERYDTTSEKTNQHGHSLQMNWQRKIDTSQNLSLRASGSYSANKQFSQTFSHTSIGSEWINRSDNRNDNKNDELDGNVNMEYLRKLYSTWRLFKLNVTASLQQSHSDLQYNNRISFIQDSLSFIQNPFQNNVNLVGSGSVFTSFTRRLNNGFYLEPGTSAGMLYDAIGRTQGIYLSSAETIDSLSPNFQSKYTYARPFISLKKSSEKVRFEITARMEAGQLQNTLNDTELNNKNYLYFLPSVEWEKEYKRQRNINFSYYSRLRTPPAAQLLPVSNSLNPLQVYKGNAQLKPEYIHQAGGRWMIFDQFSMTSFFAGINGRYTKDKISFARNIAGNLAQSLTMVNVPDDYTADASIDFSTPLRKLKLNFTLKLREEWNRGISLVNDVRNINTNITHGGTISFNNRKKDKWDVNAGISISYTDARYSIQSSLNNTYYQYNYFSEISFTPSTKFSFFLSADVMNYDGSNFKQSVMIPLLKAEVKYYFLKNNRGVLSVEAFDLLNKNTGLQRVSELNYLMERQSSIIRQYFMLSFKYKLNKFDVNNGLQLNVKMR